MWASSGGVSLASNVAFDDAKFLKSGYMTLGLGSGSGVCLGGFSCTRVFLDRAVYLPASGGFLLTGNVALDGADFLEEELAIGFTSCLWLVKVDLLGALLERPEFCRDLVMIE